jgi:beta-phosphoglucomutase
LEEVFQAIVSAEDVVHGKPDPDVFLKAAERLKMPPRKCVVFEDAYVGIQAGHAAGMKVVAVATTHSPDELREADVVVNRLDELSAEKLGALVGSSS